MKRLFFVAALSVFIQIYGMGLLGQSVNANLNKESQNKGFVRNDYSNEQSKPVEVSFIPERGKVKSNPNQSYYGEATLDLILHPRDFDFDNDLEKNGLDEKSSTEYLMCNTTVCGEEVSSTYTLTQAGSDAYIVLNPTYSIAPHFAGSRNVVVSSNVDWTVSESCDWLGCSPTSGSNDGSFTVNYDENTSTESRTCVITVSGEGVSATYVLSQAGSNEFLELFPTCANVSSSAGTLFVEVNSGPIYWEVFESCDWVSCTPTGGSWNDPGFTVIYDENTSTASRICIITVEGAGNVATFTLTQAGADTYLVLSPTFANVSNLAGHTDVSVSSNADWKVFEECDWVYCLPASGSGNGNFTVVFEGNFSIYSRSCVITVSVEDVLATYTLTQAGGIPSITLNPGNANVSSSAGNTIVTVISNVNWTVSENCDWVSCSPAFGSNDGDISVTYDENLSTQSRICMISVEGEGLIATFTLIQAGSDAYITLNPTFSNESPLAGSTVVSVSSNIVWTINESCDWVDCSPASGVNNGSFIVHYDENIFTDNRICVITVSGEGASATYTLTQFGGVPVITLNPTYINVSPAVGSVFVTVNSNIASWMVTESCDWLSCSPDIGSYDGGFSINYNENQSIDYRTCAIAVSGSGVSEDFILWQEGATAFLNLIPDEICVSYNSGSEDVTVSSNVDWIIEESCEWLDCFPVSGTGNGGFVVLYEENSTLQMRTSLIQVHGGGVQKDLSFSQGTVLIGELPFSDGIQIYPNPTSSHLEIDFNKSPDDKYVIQVFDVVGLFKLRQEFMYSNEKSITRLDISKLPNGVYFIRILDSQGNWVSMEKILKN